MPALQRRESPVDLRKAAQKPAVDHMPYPMVKTSSQSSDDMMDQPTPKQLLIPTTRMPVRYESDEESVSPCPEDFEDAATSLSEVEVDSDLELEDDEVPSIIEAVSMQIKSARPAVVNITSFAPMEKRSTAAHMRPRIAHAVNGKVNGPAVVTLGKPPARTAKNPPPIPARSEARTPVASQRPGFPPRKDSHVSRPSVSTVASNFDDDRSSIAESSSSSAPSSVADDSDNEARDQFLAEDRLCKDNVASSQDADLERAIADYMMWRSEGSPVGPAEEAWKGFQAPMSPTQGYGQGRRFAVSSDDEQWQNDMDQGLATPTPTSYAAYDPFGVDPPRLRRMDAGTRTNTASLGRPAESPKQSGPITGLKRGLGIMRRNL